MTYAYLAKGLNEQELLRLDMALAPSKEAAQETMDEANMRALRQLEGMMPGRRPRPLPPSGAR